MVERQIRNNIPGVVVPIFGALHGRPYRFLDSPKIAGALRAAIVDDDVLSLPECGAADQFTSSNCVLAAPDYAKAATTALLGIDTESAS